MREHVCQQLRFCHLSRWWFWMTSALGEEYFKVKLSSVVVQKPYFSARWWKGQAKLDSRVIFIGIICRLFSSVTTGYSDWKHASRDINHHEISPLHQSCTAKLVARRTKGERVEKALIEQHESEKKYWRQLLECILSVIKFHSSRGLAFRGSNEIIGSVLAKYDTFLAEHIQRRV